jgi:hypothetical protein
MVSVTSDLSGLRCLEMTPIMSATPAKDRYPATRASIREITTKNHFGGGMLCATLSTINGYFDGRGG